MGRPLVTHLKMGNPWVPMGTHLVHCKYLFSNQILSDKMHISWKLHYFYIYSYKHHSHIGNVSWDIEGFLINPQLKCFEIFLIFHGLLFATMTPKENCNENLRKSISGIFGKKFMGTHCNALQVGQCFDVSQFLSKTKVA